MNFWNELRRRRHRDFATLVLASTLLIASAGTIAAASSDSPTTVAKWVPRKIRFNYTPVTPSSTTTYYSCDRLQDEITSILRQLGARDEVVKPFGCITVGGPEKFAGVDATFSTLEPVGEGDQAVAGSQNVAAQWETVTLARDASCELIRQVQRSILPLFTTRNPTPSCSPRFSVEVLQPVKSPTRGS